MSPSQIVEVVSTPTARQATTNIDTAFMVGFAEKGSITATIELTSFSQFASKLGGRVTATPYLYDAADAFFREGGARIIVARRVGPSPVKASLTLNDGAGSPAPTVKVSAKTVGVDGNTISVAVGSGTLTVFYNDVQVEAFTGLSTRALYLAVVSDYVDVTATGSSSLVPATLSKTALTSGADDHAASTSTELSAALALFVKDLGPGQVLSPGSTDSTSQGLLAAHADTFDRVALLDAPDTATLATIETAATAIRGGQYARSCAMFAPWLVIPGPLQGEQRTVPPSAVAAGLMARNDLAGSPADEPAANTNGDSVSATSMSVTSWVDADRDTLNDAGVDCFKSRRGTITLWGYRTVYNPDTDQKWVPLGAARMLMQIIAECDAAAEKFVLRRMDGRQHLLVEFATALSQPLDTHVATGSLTFTFDAAGAPIPGTAYAISTDWDAGARELSAEIRLRLTDMAETVLVRLVRRATTEAL